jgi:hypothetical protein
MRDPVLAGRVEDYVEELRAHHRRLFRWTMTVVPFPFMFGPRLLEQMSPAMRTGIIYTWGGLVALFGMAVCVSAWRFDRVHAVRCPVCRTKLSANPELFLRTGKCLHCLSQRPQASPDSLPSPRVRYPLPRHTPGAREEGGYEFCGPRLHGRLVYEDEFQIVAEPFKADLDDRGV